LVKLADPGLSLSQEANALDACAKASSFSVPECVHRERGGAAIAIEWVSRAPTLWALHHQRKFPVSLARGLGEAMAELHRGDWAIPQARGSFDFAADLVWPTPDAYANANPAMHELWRRVARNAAAVKALTWLGQRAHHPALSCALHGDLRQPNVLTAARGRLVLIDWDQAAWGDPASDVGSLLGDYLTEYFVPTGAGLTLPRLRTFTGAMLRAYLLRCDSPWIREAIIGWGAVAMLRNVSVMTRQGGTMTREATHLVTAALAVLSEARGWLEKLTGVAT
jgi:aminoglycoside phosphotransferase (APT) family kinase protein